MESQILSSFKIKLEEINRKHCLVQYCAAHDKKLVHEKTVGDIAVYKFPDYECKNFVKGKSDYYQ